MKLIPAAQIRITKHKIQTKDSTASSPLPTACGCFCYYNQMLYCTAQIHTPDKGLSLPSVQQNLKAKKSIFNLKHFCRIFPGKSVKNKE